MHAFKCLAYSLLLFTSFSASAEIWNTGEPTQATAIQGKADFRREAFEISLEEGSSQLLIQGGSFSQSDVGKLIVIQAAGRGAESGQTLPFEAKIDQVLSSGMLNLDTRASVNLTAQKRYVSWGTDNIDAFRKALERTPSHGTLYVPPSEYPYGVSETIHLPANKRIRVMGGGPEMSWIAALRSMPSLLDVTTNFGSISSEIEELGLDGNTLANVVLNLASSQNGIIKSINVFNASSTTERDTANIVIGNDVTNVIENKLDQISIKNNPVLYGLGILPRFNLLVRAKATDNLISNVIAANASTANVFDRSFGANLYTRVHAYGFPAPGNFPRYSFWSLGNVDFIGCESDGSSEAGFRSDGDFNSFRDGIFGWAGRTGTAVGILLSEGVRSNLITGNVFHSISPSSAIVQKGTSNVSTIIKDNVGAAHTISDR